MISNKGDIEMVYLYCAIAGVCATEPRSQRLDYIVDTDMVEGGMLICGAGYSHLLLLTPQFE